MYRQKYRQLPVDDEEVSNALAHLARCIQCGELAVWSGPAGPNGEDYYCDGCVPRGCSCQGSDSEPCVDFWLSVEGIELPE
ncbi:MAG: hypothetical protein ACE5FQ_13565 [Thiogranum sp.]